MLNELISFGGDSQVDSQTLYFEKVSDGTLKQVD